MQVLRQTFERIDQNRDRQITKQEVLKFDVNADGQLSKQEAQQAGLNPQDLNTLNQALEKAADLEPTEVLF